ncbi:hypothetical protein PsorP6_011469 [Peronosclerospora sorghi]|uniref:Uncharacterized protein n=1 Tax=Peronosclerospora sorghi TaxID=230839 RepID=A0ACC0WHP3_9STRA|nr:hypothetical protein PsorP6_011469 [Peronosclerospora sorghi]
MQRLDRLHFWLFCVTTHGYSETIDKSDHDSVHSRKALQLASRISTGLFLQQRDTTAGLTTSHGRNIESHTHGRGPFDCSGAARSSCRNQLPSVNHAKKRPNKASRSAVPGVHYM